MEAQTAFTLLCIVLGFVVILYGALGWIFSLVLRRLFNLDIVIESLGLRSAGRISCYLSKSCSLEVLDFSIGLGTSLPWAPKSRLFSIVVHRVGVLLKSSVATPATDTSAAAPIAEVTSENDQPIPSTASSTSRITSDRKISKVIGRPFLTRFLVFALTHVDVIVKEVVVEVTSSDDTSPPVAVTSSILSGLRLDLSTNNKKGLVAQLKVHDVSVDVTVGTCKRSVGDLHLALSASVEVDLNRGLLPLSSVKVSVQSPAMTLQDKAILAIQSLLPTSKSKMTAAEAAVVETAEASDTAVLDSMSQASMSAKMAAISEKLCALLPDLVEVHIEETSARLLMQEGQRETDLELSKALFCLQRNNYQLVSLRLPSAVASSQQCSLPACDLSVMLSGAHVRCGERPPILSLQRMRLAAKISECADETSATCSSEPSEASAAGSAGAVCCVATSASLHSIQACYWHAEVKQWIALLTAGNSGTHSETAAATTSRGTGSSGKMRSSSTSVTSLLRHLPANLKLKTSVSVCDVSVGMVTAAQLNVATIAKPRCRAVLAAATLQTELEQETPVSAGVERYHRNLQSSVRLENMYVHNCQSSTSPLTSHFCASQLLCRVPSPSQPQSPITSPVTTAQGDTACSADEPSIPSVVKTADSSQSATSDAAWIGVDDPVILPASKRHLYGRPLELGGISCKVSVQLPVDMSTPSTTSSMTHDDVTTPSTPDTGHPCTQAGDDVTCIGSVGVGGIPVDVAVDVSQLCLEMSRPLLSSVSDVVDELLPYVHKSVASKRSAAEQQSHDQSQVSATASKPTAVSLHSPVFSLHVYVQVTHFNLLLLQNGPGPVMGLVHVRSVAVHHTPPLYNVDTCESADGKTVTALVAGAAPSSAGSDVTSDTCDDAVFTVTASSDSGASSAQSGESTCTAAAATVPVGNDETTAAEPSCVPANPPAPPRTALSHTLSDLAASSARDHTGLTLDVRGAAISTLAADDDKAKVLLLEKISECTSENVLLLNQIFINRTPQLNIHGTVPSVTVDWSAGQHKTFTVLAEQLLHDVKYLKNQVQLPGVAESTVKPNTSNSAGTTTSSGSDGDGDVAFADDHTNVRTTSPLPPVAVNISSVSILARLTSTRRMQISASNLLLTNTVHDSSSHDTVCGMADQSPPASAESGISMLTEDTDPVVQSTGLLRGFSLSSHAVKWGFDDETIVSLENVVVESPGEDYMKTRRAAFPSLAHYNPRGSLQLSVGSGNVCFPYGYHFGESIDKLINIVKLLKLLHKKGPPTKSGLGPDVVLKVQDFVFQLCDDPFEVKLGDNYALIVDECSEMQKRRKLLDERIQDIRNAVGEMQAAQKLDELLESLEKTNSRVYCNRSKLYYERNPLRTALLKVSMQAVEVVAMADESLQGVENEIAEMRRIDCQSPYHENLEFSTLWARRVHASAAQLEAHLRDYTQPLALVDQLSISGSLVGAEEEAAPQAIRTDTVPMAAPWSDVTVHRSMPALKFYHDVDVDAESFEASYGNCWEPVLAQLSCAVDILTKESADPSCPLPFWDKIRLLLHGRACLKSDHAIILLAASSNPYNNSEKLEIVLKSLIVTLSNALIVTQADLDIYSRTPTKYDECNIIHIPGIKISVHLEWDCHGDSNDHHAVMPWAPSKIKETMETHDSFAEFRSRSLSLDVDVDIGAEQHQIKSLLYATSLRFFQKLQVVLQMWNAPIRRGKLFNNTKPRKPTLGRFFRNLNVQGGLPSLHLLYWNSYACVRGLSAHFGSITNSINLLVTTEPITESLATAAVDQSLGSIAESIESEDSIMDIEVSPIQQASEASHRRQLGQPQAHGGWSHLIRRPTAVWNIRSAKALVDGVVMDTYESSQTISMMASVEASNPDNFADRQELLSVAKLEYFHEDDSKCKQAHDSEEKCYTHRLLVDDLKALWTFANRLVVFGLYDSYTQSTILKTDLSAESLIGLRAGDEVNADSLCDEEYESDGEGHSAGDTGTNSGYGTPAAASGAGAGAGGGGGMRRNDSFGSSSVTSSSSHHRRLTPLSSSPSFPLLEKLINDKDTKFTAVADEDRGEQGTPILFGHKLCRSDDLRELSWLVEFNNAQVVFRAPTVEGCVAVTTSSAVIMAHVHTPVMKHGELVAKTTWTSLINDMQYFASVGNITNRSPWLPASAMAQTNTDPMATERHAAPKHGDLSIGAMLGGTYTASSTKLGAMVSTVVDPAVARLSPIVQDVTLSSMHMQRLITRCVCQVHYASFGGQPDPSHVPRSEGVNGRSYPAELRRSFSLNTALAEEEPVDTFTISYPKLEIATNSDQYKLVMDIITKLLFYVDPKKKDLADRCENKRFEMELSNVIDQRTPVTEKQLAVREQLDLVRSLDRQVYSLWQDMDRLLEERLNIFASAPGGVLTEPEVVSMSEVEEALSLVQQQAWALENAIAEAKADLTETSLDLRVTISSFRASQFGLEQTADEGRSSASIERRIEVWLDNSTWSIMQPDGQLELAKVSLNNFLYVKVARTDVSGSHRFDLGWFAVQNLLPLLPDESYRDALKPSQENVKVERSKSLRVMLVEQAPVGGISVKEHFEVNVVPLTVRVTSRFYEKVRQFFFDEDAPEQLQSTASAAAGYAAASQGQGSIPAAGAVSLSENMSMSPDMDDAEMDGNGAGRLHSRPSAMSISSKASTGTFSRPSSGRRRGHRHSDEDPGVAAGAKLRSSGRRNKSHASRSAKDDIETMKARASQNKTFIYIKVPQVPLVFSYKDDGTWLELEDAVLTLPTIEYHNRTFTYHDLLMQIKHEVKIVIVPQAIKQKLRISHHFGQSDDCSDKSDKSDRATLLGTMMAKPLKGASRKLFSKMSSRPVHAPKSQLTAPSGDEVPQVSEEGSIRQPVNLQDMLDELSRLEDTSSTGSASSM